MDYNYHEIESCLLVSCEQINSKTYNEPIYHCIKRLFTNFVSDLLHAAEHLLQLQWPLILSDWLAVSCTLSHFDLLCHSFSKVRRQLMYRNSHLFV